MAASQRYATFYLNGICFGVDVVKVQEVLEFQEITVIPLAPPALPGIINLRGQILTTIDLKARLGLPANASDAPSMMMIVRTSDGQYNLIVDKIGEVRDVDPDLFEKPTETLKAAIRSITSHVCRLENQLLLVLDTDKIIQLPEDDRLVPGSEQAERPEAVVN